MSRKRFKPEEIVAKLRQVEGVPDRHRAVAAPLQHRPTPQRIGLETTRPGSHRQNGPEAGYALERYPAKWIHLTTRKSRQSNRLEDDP